jgi:hypothetical protein
VCAFVCGVFVPFPDTSALRELDELGRVTADDLGTTCGFEHTL